MKGRPGESGAFLLASSTGTRKARLDREIAIKIISIGTDSDKDEM